MCAQGGQQQDGALPSAATCSFEMHIPVYSSQAVMLRQLLTAIETEDFCVATEEIGRWVFDEEHQVIGGLLERRKEEAALFLQETEAIPWGTTEILLRAFRNYEASAHQVNAIRHLEERVSPYVLSEFANEFKIDDATWDDYTQEDLTGIFNS